MTNLRKITRAKLTTEAVREIRAVTGRAPKGHNIALAKKYGVSLTTIKMARSGEHWSHIE